MNVAAIISNPAGLKLLSPEISFRAQSAPLFSVVTSLQLPIIPLMLNISSPELSL